MKELQVESEWIQRNENQKSPKRRRTRPIREIRELRVRAPSCACCELPILSTLFSTAPDSGLPTKEVIRKVITNWFSDLSEDDCQAKYPGSRKKIIQTIVKICKEKSSAEKSGPLGAHRNLENYAKGGGKSDEGQG